MIKNVVFAATLLLGSFSLQAAEPVNINTASAAVIADRLDGIGMTKAEAIVKYREKYGSFKSVDDLGKVSGIGEATLKKIRDQVVVSSADKPKK